MTSSDDYNFYHIDDVLIRAGAISAVIVAIAIAAGQLKVQNPLFYLAVLGPASLLIVGHGVRRREKKTQAIWKTLERNVTVRVSDIIANADFTRADVLRAVRLLNNRGLGFYVWHKDTDVIEDARLGDEFVHVENCESCGAPVGLKVAVSLREVPRCPYCHAGATGGRLNLLKRDAIVRLRDQAKPDADFDFGVPVPSGRKPMSIPLFILLLFFFWPAAVAYAVYKAKTRPRFHR